MLLFREQQLAETHRHFRGGGKKLNEYLLGQIEQTFSPGTIHHWYRKLIAEKITSGKLRTF